MLTPNDLRRATRNLRLNGHTTIGRWTQVGKNWIKEVKGNRFAIIKPDARAIFILMETRDYGFRSLSSHQANCAATF